MASLLSLERYLPPYRYHQREVTRWVREWLLEPHAGDGNGNGERLLSVYETAGVETRASVVPIDEVFHPRDFETQNQKYRKIACAAGADVSRRALAASGLDPSEISLVVSVSCTGFMIPAVDAHVAEALGLGPRLARLPITESGCAGGVVGLARAADYLAAYPDRAALVLALEFSSLTFQRGDRSPTNVVSSAIFGDGGAAAVLVGPRHPFAERARLRLTDRYKVHRADDQHRHDDAQADRHFVADYLGCFTHAAEERPFGTRGVTREDHAENFEAEHCHNEEHRDVDFLSRPAVSKRQGHVSSETGGKADIRRELSFVARLVA